MLYIILAVFVSVLLLILFKLFPQYGVHTLSAIILNYGFAAITGILFSNFSSTEINLIANPWLKIAIPLGALFLIVFYLISSTAQNLSISAASVANKMSVVLPVLFSVIFLNQQLSLLRVLGVFIALLAVYLATKPKKNLAKVNNKLWLPILVFIGSGLIDIAINASNAYYINNQTDSKLFSIFTFLSAFVCGIACYIILVLSKKTSAKLIVAPKNILAGLLLGVPNFFSIYFIFKALETSSFASAQLFPVLNVSNVALSAIVGLVFFKEKLSAINFAGILLALLSIILIAF